MINRTQSRLIAQERENERRRAQRAQAGDQQADNTVRIEDFRKQAPADDAEAAAPARVQRA